MHHSAQLPHSNTRHLQTRHLDRSQTSPTHRKHPAIGRTNLPATRLHWVWIHYVHAPQPLRHLLRRKLNVCTKNETKRGRNLWAQELHSVELPTPNLQPLLPSTSKKGISIAKEARLHAIGDQLHTRDLAPVDKSPLGTFKLQTAIIAVIVYRSVLRQNRRLYAVSVANSITTKSFQTIRIMSFRTPRYLRVVP